MAVYTDATKIAAYLGATFTAAQTTQATAMAAAASDFIEQALDRSWAAGTYTDERHTIHGALIRLRHTAVTGVASVKVRRAIPGYDEDTLEPTSQYELIDPPAGHLYLTPTVEGFLAKVTYDSTETVPPIIGQFATELAAGMLALSLAGVGAATAAVSGIKRYSLWGGDLSVEYASPTTSSQGGSGTTNSTRLPALWADIERLYSRRLVVA